MCTSRDKKTIFMKILLFFQLTVKHLFVFENDLIDFENLNMNNARDFHLKMDLLLNDVSILEKYLIIKHENVHTLLFYYPIVFVEFVHDHYESFALIPI